MVQYFSIVSLGRSGSTFLGRLLDSHQQMRCFGEVFRPGEIYSSSDKTLRRFVEEDLHDPSSNSIGFKMPWDSIIAYPEIFALFLELNFKLIFLIRHNKFDQYLSMKMAQITGNWDSVEKYDHDPIYINPDEAIDYIRYFIFSDESLNLLCKKFTRLDVSYEEISAGRRYEDLQTFLGVDQTGLKPQTIRSRSVPRSVAISNYDQVEEALKAAGMAHYLDEPEVLS